MTEKIPGMETFQPENRPAKETPQSENIPGFEDNEVVGVKEASGKEATNSAELGKIERPPTDPLSDFKNIEGGAGSELGEDVVSGLNLTPDEIGPDNASVEKRVEALHGKGSAEGLSHDKMLELLKIAEDREVENKKRENDLKRAFEHKKAA